MCRRSLSLLVVFSLAASSVFAGLNFSGDRSTVRVSGGTFNVKSALSGASNNSGIIDVQSGATLALTNNITNWSGTVKSDGTVSGGDKGKYIGFSNGIYETGGVKSLLTTSVYPTVDTNSTFSLVNGDKVEAAPGTIADTIYVGPASGSGIVEATIEGQSGYSGNITVSSGATLIMNLQGALNSNITFSTLESVASTQTLDNAFTGSIKLLNDLKLADGVVLQEATGCTAHNQGCGIDLNGYSFIWGARGTSGAALKITDSTTWENAGDVVLTGSMALEEKWTFNDVNSVLQGNGNVLDMSHASACIEVPEGKSLHLSDVVLKGYSGEKILLKGSYDTANTSTVYFSNVSVHLTGAANNDKGTICVDGPTTVYPQGYLWTISGNAIDDRARLNIDGVTIWLDEGSSGDNTFGFALNYPWAAADYVNSGTIKEVAVDVEDQVLANVGAISTAQSTASSALSIANDAHSDAADAQSTADDAHSDAANAQSTADDAWALTVSNSGVIIGLTSSVNDLMYSNSAAIIGLEARIGTNEGDISTLDSLVTSTMNAAYNYFDGRVDTNVTNIATNVADIATLNTNLTNTYNYLDDRITSTLSSTHTDLNSTINTLGTRVSTTMDAAYNYFDGRVDTNVTNIATNVADIATLNTNLTNTYNYLDDRITSTLSATHTDLNSTINTLGTRVSTTMDAAYNYFDGRVDTNVTNIATNVTDIATLNTNLTNTYNYLDDRIDTNQTNISTNDTDIAEIQKGFATYKASPAWDTNPTWSYNYFVDTNNKITLNPSTARTYNASGHYIELAPGDTDVIDVNNDSGVVTLEDIRIKNYNPQAFDVETAASLKFGSGTILELSDDISLENTLYFNGGTTEIHAYGHQINLSSKDLDLDADTTLKIYNARIYGLKDTDVFDIDTSSTVELHNCEIVQTGNAHNLAAGTMKVFGNTSIKGDGAARTFQVSSNGVVAVQSGAELKLDRDMTFNYDVASSAGLTINANGKLHLNGCTFDAAGASAGLTLNAGTMIVEDKVSVVGGPSDSYPLTLGDSLAVEVLTGGIVDITSGSVDFGS